MNSLVHWQCWTFFRRFSTILFLCVHACLLGVDADYDVAIVGTSPICMIEAIYHAALGERVLLLESEERCGGAWKSITACGIENVDLGCHQIGSDKKIKEFFESYLGCPFVCLEHPEFLASGAHASCSKGHYFQGGCQSVIQALLKGFSSYHNALLVQEEVRSVYFDIDNEMVFLECKQMAYTARKLMCSSGSHFQVTNRLDTQILPTMHHYYHLYLLIEDPIEYGFTYLNSFAAGVQRAMNLTPFLSVMTPCHHLIVLQVNNVQYLSHGLQFFESLKSARYLSQDAQLVACEEVIYDQAALNLSLIRTVAGRLLEIIDTSSFWGMSKYLERWKSAIPRLDTQVTASILHKGGVEAP